MLAADALAAQTSPRVDFGRDVLPLIRQHCIGCHGPAQQMGAFRLDRRSVVIRGGSNPNDVVPGNSAASRLYLRLIDGQFGAQMPPTGALSKEEIATFKNWIDQGALWPDDIANEMDFPPADPEATELMQAVRNGNLASIKKYLAQEPKAANAKGPGGSTPLMYAALYGDIQSLRWLLDAGADPNVRNNGNASALMWAIGDLEKTRLLLDRGADVNARSDEGRTPLAIAAGQRESGPVVKLLLDRGANPTAGGRSPNDATPLELAARMADVEVMEMLLDHGSVARSAAALTQAIRAKCARCIELLVDSVPKSSLDTVLVQTTRWNEPAAVRTLLERGADVNAQDREGRTALMLAAASEFMSVDIVKSLLEHGADLNAKSPEGDTALSFARLRGENPIVDLLVKAGAKPVTARLSSPAAKPMPASSIRVAVERSIPLLQKSDVKFLQSTGCVSCHQNSLTAMTVSIARKNGFVVDERIARQQLTVIGARLEDWRERALQGLVLADAPIAVAYTLIGMAAEQFPPNPATDAMAMFLLNQQLPDGRWRTVAHRPPLEFSDVTATATAIRSLQLYAPKNETTAMKNAIKAAAAWLIETQPSNSEERNMRLLGLAWARDDKQEIQKAARELIALQRADGGWAQLPSLNSDAYATGQALAALLEAGTSPHDSVYQRGVQFLLNTQLEDGSWLVRTRSIPTQPYSESGFPHGLDQWISAAGTNWATMALAQAAR
jgi:ankyrin repeat protein